MRRTIFYIILLLTVIAFLPSELGATKTMWRSLDKGLEYTSIRLSPGTIHAFRINPKNYRFGVATAKELGKKNSTVDSMAKARGALLAINGGFFTPEYDSLGLLIDNGKTLNPFKNTSWWSIFYIRSGVPNIIHASQFRNDKRISMAVESGPRLLVNGSIPKLKPSFAERSAICVTKKKEVVIVATENLVIQPTDLADRMRKSEGQGGFACQTALNLDGGSSTQLYAKVGGFKLDVDGLKQVANAVVVLPK